jgi:hypothetical protein
VPLVRVALKLPVRGYTSTIEVVWFRLPALLANRSFHSNPVAAEESAVRAYPFVPTPSLVIVLDAVAARISPFVVARFIPRMFVVAVGNVRVPVLEIVEITGVVRVKPATVVVVVPKVSAVEPSVNPELANLTLVTLASTIFPVVTDRSAGVLTSERRVSLP